VAYSVKRRQSGEHVAWQLGPIQLSCDGLAPACSLHAQAKLAGGITMSRIVRAAVLTLAVILPAVPAQAQSGRTFVSAAGSDTNNCANVVTPCRHFATAFAATANNGEIYVLDPANYGSLTINHAVSIQGHGWGSIAPPAAGAAITINAGPNDVVNLDGLTIDGGGVGNNGIVFNSGNSLTIANCVARNMIFEGLTFNQTGANEATLTVSNSYFSNNSDNGILIESGSSGRITASIDRTVLSRNPSGAGLLVQGSFGTGPIHVGVTDSVAANNSTGFSVQSNAGHAVISLSLTHTAASGNSLGLQVGANATLWLAQSTLSGNLPDFAISPGGAIMSYGDNYLVDPGFINSGTLTSVAKQ
jgi:hypothetical protein